MDYCQLCGWADHLIKMDGYEVCSQCEIRLEKEKVNLSNNQSIISYLKGVEVITQKTKELCMEICGVLFFEDRPFLVKKLITKELIRLEVL